MKYSYTYKTSDGVRHEDSMEAASREQVFEALREKGIRPIKVVAADGSKANGEVKARKGRWIAIVIMALLLALTIVFALFHDNGLRQSASNSKFSMSSVRRQPIGDIAVIEKGLLTGWSDVFQEEGERFLAGFAVPGVPVTVRNTTEGEIVASLERKILPRDTDSDEAMQIKSMVEGLKTELREFLADGGTIMEYGACLVERQEKEIAIYNQAKTEIENAKNAGLSKKDLIAIWEEQNSKLRNLGIKLVAFPSE